MEEPAVRDSATVLDGLEGRVAVVASHAGRYAAYLCAAAGLRAVLLHDAAVGRDAAGIAGLGLLDDAHVPAAAVSGAVIGDGWDCACHGVVSHVNRAAAALGVTIGMSCLEGARHLGLAASHALTLPMLREVRHVIAPGIIALDSAGLIGPEDVGLVVATGSHGNLLGGRPQSAAKADVLAALFNDAGDPAPSRLPALEARAIAAATVSAASARIGDGRSTATDGVLSHVNAAAAACGVRVGMPATEALALLAMAREKRA